MNASTKERWTSGRWVRVVCAGWIAVALVACQSQESGTASTAPVAKSRVLPPRVDERTLESHGLETAWYNPPPLNENKVLQAYLLGSGLFVATQPVPGRPGRLTRILRNDGMTKWKYDLDGELLRGPSVFRRARRGRGESDEVYISLNDTVHCIGLEYGDLLWKRPAPYGISTMVVADDSRYFAGSENGRVFGVLKDNSIEDWPYRTGGFVQADPVYSQGSVFFASTDASLYKLSAVKGWQQGSSWEHKTGSRIVARPVAFSQWVFVGSTDYKLYCLNAVGGTVVWDFLAEAPIVDEPIVYSFRPGQEIVLCIGVSTRRGQTTRTLFAVRLHGQRGGRGGTELWRKEGVRKVVSIGEKNLYVLADGERAIVALDALSGEERYRIDVDPRFKFLPTNKADFGRDPRQRGRFILIAQDGTAQAIAEKK